VQLGLKSKSEKGLSVRLDLAIVDGFNVFQWVSTGDEKYSSSVFSPLLQNEEAQNDVESPCYSYINGFNNLFLRSTFIDLNQEVMSGLACASLVVNVVALNEKAAEPAGKPAKGAPPVEAKPAEETLMKLVIPLHALLTAKNCTISLFQPLSEVQKMSIFSNSPGSITVGSNVDDTQSSITFKLASDNDFAEYVMGCKILRWEGAQLRSPPAAWGLHAIDVIDPKAKVPPTAADLRAKYLENMARLVNDQANVCSFELSVGVAKGGAADGQEEAELDNQQQALADASALIAAALPFSTLAAGKIAYDATAAAEVPVDEDLRARGDLWSGETRKI
jgi:hypothetical protein